MCGVGPDDECSPDCTSTLRRGVYPEHLKEVGWNLRNRTGIYGAGALLTEAAGEIERLQSELETADANTQLIGEVLAELAHATLIVRGSPPHAGEIHHKPCFVGSSPRISERAMVFVREAMRPINAPPEGP